MSTRLSARIMVPGVDGEEAHVDYYVRAVSAGGSLRAPGDGTEHDAWAAYREEPVFAVLEGSTDRVGLLRTARVSSAPRTTAREAAADMYDAIRAQIDPGRFRNRAQLVRGEVPQEVDVSNDPMTLDAVWSRAVSASLTHTVGCKIVTSGYDDRYLSMDSRYVLSLDDHGTRVEWSGKQDVCDALLVLTGRTIREVGELVSGVTPRYVSSWQSADHRRSTIGPVRPEVLRAIADLAWYEAPEGLVLTAEAVAAATTTAKTATTEELECARYWLAECDRMNALTGRPQVAFPRAVSS